jgi:spermidine dehydrogenase
MFPGGNTGVARHIVKALIPDALSGPVSVENICRTAINFDALDKRCRSTRLRLGVTVVSVEHQGDPASADRVRVVYARQGKLYSVTAQSVIMAGGSWTAKHIIKNVPLALQSAYAQFYRAPCLMANVFVRNWKFLYAAGMDSCRWFEGLGHSMTIRRTATMGDVAPAISPESPIVLNLKILFTSPGLPIGEQVTRGRIHLFSTSFSEFERRIRAQFTEMFSAYGFDARRDIAGLILNRWGHAYLAAQPGFFFGSGGSPAPGETLRNQPFGRIAFANSDLTGIMDHRASITEAQRAVLQALPQLA